MKPVRIAVGGGIGSGKSEVMRMLAERGFTTLDADRVGHRVLAPGHPAAASAAERWPEALTEGRIDRSLLGCIVFGDPLQLAELEALTHPAILAEVERWAAEAGERPAAVEVSVLSVMKRLAGKGWMTAAVDAAAGTRRERLRLRGMTEADIEARMAVQPDPGEWTAAAGLVVDNNAGRGRLASEVDRLAGLLLTERRA